MNMVTHVLNYGFTNKDMHTVSGAFHVLHRDRAFAHAWPQIASRRAFVELIHKKFGSSRQFGWDEDGEWHAYAKYYYTTPYQLQHSDHVYIDMVNLFEAASVLAMMLGIKCRLCSEVKPPFWVDKSLYHFEYYVPLPFKPPERAKCAWPAWLALTNIRDMPFVDEKECQLPLLCWECTDGVIHFAWGRGCWEERRDRLEAHQAPVLAYALKRLRGEARRQFKLAV